MLAESISELCQDNVRVYILLDHVCLLHFFMNDGNFLKNLVVPKIDSLAA